MSKRSSVPQPETLPGTANAEEGLVVLDGPDGIAVTMTAEAASKTGHNLITAADLAVKQLEAAKSRAEGD